MSALNQKKRPVRLIIGGGLLIVLAALALLLLISKENISIAGEVKARDNAFKKGPVVTIVSVGHSAPQRELILIGEARPFQNAVLYAKTSGYLDKILVDKGDKVRQGQLLATILSPEVDQEYQAAIADLENKRRVLDRDKKLLQKDYISTEDKEQTETGVKMAEARVKSLQEQQQYKNIIAPFSGTVTARFADRGALVQNATNSQTSALPVVTVAQLDKIRIYVYIEQKDAAYVRNGYPVVITLSERPAFSIKAKVLRMAGELDPRTRMMLAEIDLPNTKDAIIPGSYVQVHIQGPATSRLQIPSDALVLRKEKYFVALVRPDNTLHFQEIGLGENTGVTATVMSGLQESDRVAVHVGEDLTEGQQVRPEK
ncbi:efflux RND transporter periplasmic adaptor subunit [Flavitalea flava]